MWIHGILVENLTKISGEEDALYLKEDIVHDR